MANPTSAQAWSTKRGTDLELPSGNVCKAKRPGMEKILTSGVIPDDMAQIALKQIAQAERGVPSDHQQKGSDQITREQMAELIKTPQDIYRMMDSFDRIAADCVMEPSLLWHKREVLDETGRPKVDDKGQRIYQEMSDSQRRDYCREAEISYDSTLWTDQVDLDDKVFIFNWAVGGSSDLQKFREEYSDGVDAVSASEDVEHPSE